MIKEGDQVRYIGGDEMFESDMRRLNHSADATMTVYSLHGNNGDMVVEIEDRWYESNVKYFRPTSSSSEQRYEVTENRINRIVSSIDMVVDIINNSEHEVTVRKLPKMAKIGNYEYPAPITTMPGNDDTVWYVSLSNSNLVSDCPTKFISLDLRHRLIKNRIAHLSESAARQHAEAILKAMSDDN